MTDSPSRFAADHTPEAVELLVLIRDGADSIALVSPEPEGE